MNARVVLPVLAKAALAATVLAGAVPAAIATPVTNLAEVSVSPNVSGGTGAMDQTVQQTGTVNAAASATGGSNASGNGTAHVQYGLVGMSGTAVGSLTTLTRGYMRDNVTITAPGVPAGTPGTLNFTVTVGGWAASNSGSSGCSWALQGDLNGGAFQLNKAGHQNSPPPGGAYVGDPFGTYTSGTVNFQFGAPMILQMQMTVNAQGGTGVATFDMPQAITWGGLSNVKANGVPVNFSVSSDSGTNWGPPANICSADFNNDGDIGTDADIEAFFACLSGHCCPACGSADFNGDGDTGTDADIEAFFRVLAGGSC